MKEKGPLSTCGTHTLILHCRRVWQRLPGLLGGHIFPITPLFCLLAAGMSRLLQVFVSNILLISHIQLVWCIATPTSIRIVSKQSAFIRMATMATANFQISLRPHGTNGRTCPRRSKCAVTQLRNTLWE